MWCLSDWVMSNVGFSSKSSFWRSFLGLKRLDCNQACCDFLAPIFFHFPLAKSAPVCPTYVSVTWIPTSCICIHSILLYCTEYAVLRIELFWKYYNWLSNQKLYPNDRATQRRINHHLITSTARGIIVVQSRKTTLYITKAVLNHRRQNKSRKEGCKISNVCTWSCVTITVR